MLPQSEPQLNSRKLDLCQRSSGGSLPRKQLHARQREEMIRSIRLLTEPGQVVEVRVLGVGGRDNRTASGYFDDYYALCDAALATYVENANGIYITPNVVNPTLLARSANRIRSHAKHTTGDSDILRRRWLFIDVDPIRPSGISSSNFEHEAALAKAREIRAWLADRGWPDPILADSGNGAHLLYRVDLINDDRNTVLMQQVLEALAFEWNDDTVTVDTSTYNAGRLCKLYGTKVRKGDHTTERPHRWSYLLEAPQVVQLVSIELIEELAQRLPLIVPTKRSGGMTVSHPFDLEEWMTRYNLQGKRRPWKDGTIWRLDECPFSDAHTDGAFVGQLGNGAIVAGCLHSSCRTKGWPDLREILEAPRGNLSHAADVSSLAAPAPAPGSLEDRTHIVAELLGMNRSGMPPLPPGVALPAELAAGACLWLDDYVAFSRRWSPRAYDDFHVSVGLWLLSTVAARRVMLDFGGERFTNLNIALTARTSLYAKSTTARIAIDLLRAAGLAHLLAPDDATPQAFLRSMMQVLPLDWEQLSPLQKSQTLARLSFAAQKGWFYDEFGQKVSAMMRDGGHMSDFRGQLRRFDDCPDQYEYVSISRGSTLVQKPYLSLLANLTPADLMPFAGRRAALWNDGSWARFVFVTPSANAEVGNGHFPLGERRIPDEIIQPIRLWHRRLGVPEVVAREVPDRDGSPTGRFSVECAELPIHRCRLGDSVAQAANRYADAMFDIVRQTQNEDLDGNYARLPEKCMRVAMLMASLENREQIEMRHWARAQEIAEMWRRNLHDLYDQVATVAIETKARSMEERILLKLAEKGALTQRELYQGIWGLDAGMAATLLKSMEEAGLVIGMPEGRTLRYHLIR